MSPPSLLPKKKAKVSDEKQPEHTQRKRVKLDTVPADIVLEIASYLPPMALIKLARTNKALRSILMSKSSRSAWIHALRSFRHRLPHCPEGMAEPMLVYLFLEYDCTVCGKEHMNRIPDPYLRVRLCKTHAVMHVLSMRQVKKQHPEWDNELFDLVPNSPTSPRGKRSEKEKYVFVPAVVDMHRLCEERRNSGTPEEYDAWIAVRRQEVKKIHETARRIAWWWGAVKEEKRMQKEATRWEMNAMFFGERYA